MVTPPRLKERERERERQRVEISKCRLIGVYHLFPQNEGSLKTTSYGGNAFVAPSSRVHVHTGSRASDSKCGQLLAIFLYVCRVQLEIFSYNKRS